MDTNPQPTLRITPPEPRSMLVPLLLAAVAIAVAVAIALHFFPATSIDITHIHTEVVEEHTTFKSESIVVGASGETDLYVATTVRIDNEKRMPLFIDGIQCTFTSADDSVVTDGAVPTAELPVVEQTFPALAPLLTQPLLREQTIPRDTSATGTVLLHFRFPKATWDTRKSAVLKIDFYHQDQSIYLTIPKP